MGTFLVWLISATITLTVLYLCYSLLLSRSHRPAFNRGVLLTIYLISLTAFFIFPLFNLPVSSDGPVTVVATYSVSYASLLTARFWLRLFTLIYFVGMGVMLGRSIYGLITLRRNILKSERIGGDGYIIAKINKPLVSPYSWKKYIVINQNDYESPDKDMIITHELCHLKQHHWIDLLIADTVLILQWFNPAAWLMRDELKDVHEYLADESVIAAGYDEREYQLMLIGKAVGRKVSFVGNSLRHGKMKRRISMMSYSASSRRLGFRLLFFPIVLVALAGVANTSRSKYICDNILMAYDFQQPSAPMQKSGVNETEIYVDGKQIDRNELNRINPATIKQITVNKSENHEGTVYIETK